jgi:hypothetical protein
MKIRCIFFPSRLDKRDVAHRHERGERDAVDATVSEDERRWRGRRSRVVLTPRRWRSSGDNACALRLRWWQTSPVTRESAKEAVKTIAQGRPDRSGEPVVTYSYAFSFCMRGCGCDGHPVFPAPSVFRGANDLCMTRAQTCRGNAKPRTSCPGRSAV